MFNRHLKQEIAELRSQLASLTALDNAINRSNAVIRFDTDGKVVWANDLFLRTMGYQTLAQIDLWANKDVYEKTVYRLPKHLDEEVARLHLEKIGVKLTTLTQDQADYLGVAVEGPYKPDHYRY